MDLNLHFWILTRAFKLSTRAFKLSTRNSCFTVSHNCHSFCFLNNFLLSSDSASLKSDSHLPKKYYLLQLQPFKNDENAFYFILKAIFVLKIFRFLSWLLGHVEKTAWLERKGYFRNLWRRSLVNKELQRTYCSISHELKATRQWNLVSW